MQFGAWFYWFIADSKVRYNTFFYMKKVKFITSSFALLFGLFIFSTSLIVSSQIGSNNFPKVSQRTFYVSERILPDHVFYPILMIADKIIMRVNFGNARIYVKIRLAEDRMYSSKMLLKKNQEELALSTMTKSQKYLITAAQDFFSNGEQSDLVRRDLLLALASNMHELEDYQSKFKVVNTAPIGDLLEESIVLINQLKS